MGKVGGLWGRWSGSAELLVSRVVSCRVVSGLGRFAEERRGQAFCGYIFTGNREYCVYAVL